jgi:hypothetical protein
LVDGAHDVVNHLVDIISGILIFQLTCHRSKNACKKQPQEKDVRKGGMSNYHSQGAD